MTEADWRNDLGKFFDRAEDENPEKTGSGGMGSFIDGVVVPAFREISSELEKYGRTASIRSSAVSASILVQYNGEEEMNYSIQGRTFPNGVLPYAEIRFRERKGLKFIGVESMIRSGNPDYTLNDVTSEEVIRNFLDHYVRRVQID